MNNTKDFNQMLKELIIDNWKGESITEDEWTEWLANNYSANHVYNTNNYDLKEAYFNSFDEDDDKFFRFACILDDFKVELPEEWKKAKLQKLFDSIDCFIENLEQKYQLNDFQNYEYFSDEVRLYLLYLSYLKCSKNNSPEFIKTLESISSNLQRVYYKFDYSYENAIFDIIGELFFCNSLNWEQLVVLEKICDYVANEKINKIISSIPDTIVSEEWDKTLSDLDCVELETIIDIKTKKLLPDLDKEVYDIDEDEFNLAIEEYGEPYFLDSNVYVSIYGSDPNDWNYITDLEVIYKFINQFNKDVLLDWIENIIKNQK